ncbi:MgtC/SapB family protein [Microbacterium sp. KUDC0406]|uniref:MgtC/SapB family protein n=1 Tax=Microbacterium sp. KUDC0406 TaxID=2909588 RepID=UPI001F372733|nr:MgtC/SapB family protein [Microbacterium sp. KUDC0406]UJP08979.1 MgtC/SapB family protein [Microbacterium sp. KUDC0406]
MESIWLLQLQVLPEIAVALVLSMAIGLERQLRSKNAGVRTHSLVGVGSCLFMLVSKYGFVDVLGVDAVSVDPTRVAAQIVSGVGFLGAGLIVFRSDAVRGLTTAASIWLVAAVGMAAGGRLFIIAAVVVGCHYLIIAVGPRLNRLRRRSEAVLYVEYPDGLGVLRAVIKVVTDHRFQVSQLSTDKDPRGSGEVRVMLNAEGRGDAGALVDAVGAIDGVRSVGWAHDEEYE